jgi:hypothetical protein
MATQNRSLPKTSDGATTNQSGLTLRGRAYRDRGRRDRDRGIYTISIEYIYTYIYTHIYAGSRVLYKYKKTDFWRVNFVAFFCAAALVKTINRTIVSHNPTKPLVLWDKTMLKDLIGNAFVGDI